MTNDRPAAAPLTVPAAETFPTIAKIAAALYRAVALEVAGLPVEEARRPNLRDAALDLRMVATTYENAVAAVPVVEGIEDATPTDAPRWRARCAILEAHRCAGLVVGLSDVLGDLARLDRPSADALNFIAFSLEGAAQAGAAALEEARAAAAAALETETSHGRIQAEQPMDADR